MFHFGKTEEEAGRLNAMETNFAIISFEPSGKILHANDNFLNALGYRLGDVVGNHHKMFCRSDYTSSSAYTKFWNDLANGISQVDEFERIRKDGSSIWIQASYTPVKNNNGKVTRVVKFAQDITESKKVIDAVKKAIDIAKTGIMKQTIKESTQNEGIEELKNGINEVFHIVSSKVDGDLNKISDALTSFQKLDFTHRISGDLGETSKGLNSLANVVNDMLVENKQNGLTLDYSSDILLKNVDLLNTNSNEAAAALEETAAALEEVTSNISSTTTNIVKMAHLAGTVTQASNEGKALATETTQAMDEINKEVNSINEAITIIDQIAFQTNILSLNAAVEAATAGEAGKGFAVVAQEVRNLATRSADAANEIKKLVQNATAKANNGKQIADKMISGYANLNNNIEQTINLIRDVEMASKEQLGGINQINDAVSSLDQQTQRNAQIASQTHDVAVDTDTIAKLVVASANEKEFIGKNDVKAKEMRKPNQIQIPTINPKSKVSPSISSASNSLLRKPVDKTTSSNAPIQPIIASKDDDEWASF